MSTDHEPYKAEASPKSIGKLARPVDPSWWDRQMSEAAAKAEGMMLPKKTAVTPASGRKFRLRPDTRPIFEELEPEAVPAAESSTQRALRATMPAGQTRRGRMELVSTVLHPDELAECLSLLNGVTRPDEHPTNYRLCADGSVNLVLHRLADSVDPLNATLSQDLRPVLEGYAIGYQDDDINSEHPIVCYSAGGYGCTQVFGGILYVGWTVDWRPAQPNRFVQPPGVEFTAETMPVQFSRLRLYVLSTHKRTLGTARGDGDIEDRLISRYSDIPGDAEPLSSVTLSADGYLAYWGALVRNNHVEFHINISYGPSR